MMKWLRHAAWLVMFASAGWAVDWTAYKPEGFVSDFAKVIDEGLRMLGWGGRYLEMGTFYTGTSFECDPGRLVGQKQRIEAVASYDAVSLQRGIDFLGRNAGRLPLDEVVVDYPLEKIEQAFADQDAGRTRRASLTMV